MLEHYFRKPSTVDRIRANWLAPQIERYVEWMHTQNYAARNILRRVPLLCHFADFARKKGATDLASSTLLVDTFASHWVAGANCKNAVTRRNLRDDIQSIVLQRSRLALEGRVTQNRQPKRFLLQSEAPRFFQYLRDERGFSEGVISRYLRYLNRFAVYLKRVGVTSLSELSPVYFAPTEATDTIRNLQTCETAYSVTPSSASGSKRCGVSPHVFRHSTAVHLLEQGVDVKVIRGWLGYVSLETTNRYAEIGLRTKQAAVAACLPPIDTSEIFRPSGGCRKDQDLMKWLCSL